MEYQKTTVEFSLKSNKIKCPKCPARLPNEPSFQQHYGFHGHGRDFGFNCSSCDFGAESAHALMLHEFIHEIMAEKAMMKSGMSMSISTVPMRGQGQGQQYVNATISPKATTATPSRRVYKPDDEACEGNPEFNYPTYVKNGKMKEKRYKCKKCPSAFEKRDQYNVHMGLHGSEQRYKCTICDYSVTYYANFAQHLKKHQSQPEIPKELLEALATPLSKLVTSNTAAYRCTQCPYYSISQNEVIEHEGQHGRTSPGLVHCQFCDFAVGDNRALDRHIKFHFQNSPPSSFLYGSNENDQKNDEDDGDEGEGEGQGQTGEEQQGNQNYAEMLKHLPIDMYEDEEEEEQGQGQGHDDFEDEDEDDDGME
jgi:KRAB domain-containing zinc finger protein